MHVCAWMSGVSVAVAVSVAVKCKLLSAHDLLPGAVMCVCVSRLPMPVGRRTESRRRRPRGQPTAKNAKTKLRARQLLKYNTKNTLSEACVLCIIQSVLK
jgi:hypothetical protein